MGAASAPFSFILLAQALGVFSEIFGQRVSRVTHGGSPLRVLISSSLFCAVQSLTILGALELGAPALVDGQGPFSAIRAVIQRPILFLNAVNNSVWWLSLALLLRQPFGALLVVLGFLAATFAVEPLQRAAGLSAGAPLPADAVVLGLLGACAAAAELDPRRADALRSALQRFLRRSGGAPANAPAAVTLARAARGAEGNAREAEDEGLSPEKARSQNAPVCETEAAASPSAASPTREPDVERAALLPADGPDVSGGLPAAAPAAPRARWYTVTVAFFVLVVTTALGVSLATWAATPAGGGLKPAGMTSLDQVLLPLTTLPLAAWIFSRRWACDAIGEPLGSADAPSFRALLARTWAEARGRGTDGASAAGEGNGVGEDASSEGGASTPASERPPPPSRGGCARWPPLLTEITPFHASEFVRSILFYYLVTA
jgi:hypothetical protein